MNLLETRTIHPLLFVVLATVVAVACFSVVPTTTLGLVFAQEALAASCMLALLALAQPDVLSRKFRRPLDEPPSAIRRSRMSLAFVTVLIFANALLVGIAAALSAGGKIAGDGALAAPTLPTASPGSIALFLAVCLTTGIFEEGLFRGIISRGFSDALRAERRTCPALVGAIASATMFGLLHTVNTPGSELSGEVAFAQLAMKTVQASLFGFVMSAALAHTGSLWTVVGLHTGFNVLSMGPAFMITVKMPSTYATGDPTDLAALLASVVLLVPLAIHAWRVLKHAAPPRVREPPPFRRRL